MKRGAAWLTQAALLGLLGGCNTFDDRGAGDGPFGGPVVPPDFAGRPRPPLVGGSGAAGSGGAPGPVVAGSSGAGPFPGGWQPVDAGPPAEADSGSDDAGR